MRQSNGSGSIYKLSGNRRKPYAVQVTTHVEYDEKKDKYILKRKYLGYYATQKEARQALAEYNSANITPDAYSLTLRDIWKLTKNKRLDNVGDRRKTLILSKYKKYVEPYDSALFKNLKTADLQKIIDGCCSVPCKREVKGILRSCYDYALENDICNKDYLHFVKIDAYETKIQRTILSERVPGFESGPNSLYNDITLILLYTGCRSAEILANSTLFDTESKVITIEKAKNKTSCRVIPMHEKIVEICKRYNEASRPTYKMLYSWTTERGFTPHDTRHTFITRARECGMDKLVIQRLVGHKPETLLEDRYTHLTMDELRTELNKLCY